MQLDTLNTEIMITTIDEFSQVCVEKYVHLSREGTLIKELAADHVLSSQDQGWLD